MFQTVSFSDCDSLAIFFFLVGDLTSVWIAGLNMLYVVLGDTNISETRHSGTIRKDNWRSVGEIIGCSSHSDNHNYLPIFIQNFFCSEHYFKHQTRKNQFNIYSHVMLCWEILFSGVWLLFPIHLFNPVKLCHHGCLSYLMVLIKSWTANSKARTSIGRACWQRISVEGEILEKQNEEQRESKESRTSGASHPVTQQATKKDIKKGIQK